MASTCPICRCTRGPYQWSPLQAVPTTDRTLTAGIAGQVRGRNVAFVDAGLWPRLGHLEKVAVLAHETAHAEKDRDCEACADYGMGALLRRWGEGESAIQAFARLVPHRRVIRYAREGFYASTP